MRSHGRVQRRSLHGQMTILARARLPTRLARRSPLSRARLSPCHRPLRAQACQTPAPSGAPPRRPGTPSPCAAPALAIPTVGSVPKKARRRSSPI